MGGPPRLKLLSAGKNYAATIQLLNAKNQILLRNTEPLAPAQAAGMRAQMQVPDRLPADRPIVSARITNVGQGLLAFLFEDDFIRFHRTVL